MVDDDDDDGDDTLVDDLLETVAVASVVDDDDEGSLAPWPFNDGTCTYCDRWTDKYSFIGRVKGRISFLYKRS